MGTLFDPGTVDKVVGHGLAHDIFGWSRVATGAFRVLKPGGRVSIGLRWAQPQEMKLMVDAFRAAGFRDVVSRREAALQAVRP
jgi:hypothetical protein